MLHCLCGFITMSVALFIAMFVPAGSDAFVDDAKEPSLRYERRDTRQATWEASLAASKLPVFGPWRQVGPFDPILRRPQPPEKTPNTSEYALYRGGTGGGTGRWTDAPEYIDGYANPLNTERIKPATLKLNPTICLARRVAAKNATRIRVYLGSDTGFILWLNGKPLLYNDTVKKLQPGQESVELPLLKGENTLVLKLIARPEPTRFFFMPELGADVNEALLARLERDFPTNRRPLDGYRERARRRSTDAEDAYYRLTEIPTPPGVSIEGGGMDFLPDGRLAVGTRRGFVYLVENPGSDDPQQVRFRRFASGLHEALGLKVVDGGVVVVNKGELTRLIDTDDDGVADRFENLSNEWGLTGNYHEYAYGLDADREGNLYVALNASFPKGGPASAAPYRGWVVRVTPDGEFEPFCHGFRSPNGVGTNAEGDVFVTDNQGDWVPACPLYHIEEGRFYGHPVSIRWTPEALAKGFAPDNSYRSPVSPTPPAVWFPYDELCQSATDVVCDRSRGRFGPFADQLFVGEMTKGLVIRVALEKVQGRYQGACFLFRRGCGAVNRMTFGPDGALYLARVNRGWGGGGLGEGLARLSFTGRTPMEIERVHLVGRDGFELTFTKPLAEGAGGKPGDYTMEQYGYHYWQTYGSPRINLESVHVTSVAVSSNRRTVRLTTGALTADRVCRIVVNNVAASDDEALLHNEAFYTINAFPARDE